MSARLPSPQAVGIAAMLALSTACMRAPEEAVRVATFPWPGYASLHLAQALSYVGPEQVRLVEMVNNTQASEAMRTGTVDAATMTLDEALVLMQDGVDLRVVLVMDGSNGADAVMARPPLAAPADLRGKRIGVEVAAVGAVMLDAVLVAGGLTASDVTLVPLTLNLQADAYLAGTVDAVVTFEPVRSQLLAHGARVLFDSRSIPGRIADVLAVRTDALAAHASALAALVDGHFRAVAYLRQHGDDAAARLAPFLRVAPGKVLTQFDGITIPDLAENRASLSGAAPTLPGRAAALGALLKERKLLRTVPSLDRLVDARFLPAVAP